jgi:hypothetical protein
MLCKKLVLRIQEGFSMKMTKLIAASALAMSFALPALAQEETALQERNVYLFMNGKMVHMQVNDATHGMIMREFKPLPAGTMIYVSGGKLYTAQDRKMSGGKMLSTEVFGKDLGIGTER